LKSVDELYTVYAHPQIDDPVRLVIIEIEHWKDPVCGIEGGDKGETVADLQVPKHIVLSAIVHFQEQVTGAEDDSILQSTPHPLHAQADAGSVLRVELDHPDAPLPLNLLGFN